MKTAAVYVRKSNRQDVSADVKSTARQTELACDFARLKGWMVPPHLVFADDAVSGAETAKLVARRRMLQAADEGKFQILVVRDLDRLSRDDRDLPPLALALNEADVTVWCYGDGQPVDLATAMGRAMVNLKATFSAVEREKTSQRVREKLERLAARGAAAGCRAYGFTHVIVPGPDGKRSHVVREPREDPAAIVQRIFEERAAGRSHRQIAWKLTEDGVTPSRGSTWAPESVRYILKNRLYVGEQVWGRSTTVIRRGRAHKQKSDGPLTIAATIPIIDRDLWDRAQAVSARMAAVHTRNAKGHVISRTPGSRPGPHLLSGHLQCGICKGSLYAEQRSHRAQPDPAMIYTCHAARFRGPLACPTRLRLPMETIDALILRAIAVAMTDTAITRALATLSLADDADTLAGQRAQLVVNLAVCNTAIEGLQHQLEQKAPWTLIQAPWEARQQEREKLMAEIAELDSRAATVEQLTGKQKRTILRQQAQEVRKLLAEGVNATPEVARQQVGEILGGQRLVVTPEADGCRIDGGVTVGEQCQTETTRLTGGVSGGEPTS
jgi:DNA invertase Pin-like site-specific DNA recombinase